MLGFMILPAHPRKMSHDLQSFSNWFPSSWVGMLTHFDTLAKSQELSPWNFFYLSLDAVFLHPFSGTSVRPSARL